MKLYELHMRLRHPVWAAIVTFMACLAIFVIRAPDAIYAPQFWAEDGAVFFQAQFGHLEPKLALPYAGYIHFIPRLVAWGASFLPVLYAPLIYSISAAMINAAAITVFTYRIKFAVPALASLASFALMPSNGEVFGTLTNIQWFLQFSLFALIFIPAQNEARNITTISLLKYFVIFAIGLTGPFSFLSLILIACITTTYCFLRLFHRKAAQTLLDWWCSLDKKALLTLTLAGVIQAYSLLILTERLHSGLFSLERSSHIFSEGLARHCIFYASNNGIKLFLSIFFFIIIFAIRCIARRNIKWLVMLLMISFGALQLLAISNSSTASTVDVETLSGDRYYVFIKISIYVAGIYLLSEIPIGRGNFIPLFVPIFLAALICRNPNLGQRQALEKLNWAASAKLIEQEKFPLELPINPSPWKISLNAPSRSRGQ